MHKSLNELLEKLPTEEETARYLAKLEERTGVRAERVVSAAESLAERLTGGLKFLESQAERAEGFAERVNAHVEGRPAAQPPTAEPLTEDPSH